MDLNDWDMAHPSREVNAYDAGPSAAQAIANLPTLDEPYKFGHPGILLSVREQARALIVRSRFESTHSLALRQS